MHRDLVAIQVAACSDHRDLLQVCRQDDRTFLDVLVEELKAFCDLIAEAELCLEDVHAADSLMHRDHDDIQEFLRTHCRVLQCDDTVVNIMTRLSAIAFPDNVDDLDIVLRHREHGFTDELVRKIRRDHAGMTGDGIAVKVDRILHATLAVFHDTTEELRDRLERRRIEITCNARDIARVNHLTTERLRLCAVVAILVELAVDDCLHLGDEVSLHCRIDLDGTQDTLHELRAGVCLAEVMKVHMRNCEDVDTVDHADIEAVFDCVEVRNELRLSSLEIAVVNSKTFRTNLHGACYEDAIDILEARQERLTLASFDASRLAINLRKHRVDVCEQRIRCRVRIDHEHAIIAEQEVDVLMGDNHTSRLDRVRAALNQVAVDREFCLMLIPAIERVERLATNLGKVASDAASGELECAIRVAVFTETNDVIADFAALIRAHAHRRSMRGLAVVDIRQALGIDDLATIELRLTERGFVERLVQLLDELVRRVLIERDLVLAPLRRRVLAGTSRTGEATDALLERAVLRVDGVMADNREIVELVTLAGEHLEAAVRKLHKYVILLAIELGKEKAVRQSVGCHAASRISHGELIHIEHDDLRRALALRVDLRANSRLQCGMVAEITAVDRMDVHARRAELRTDARDITVRPDRVKDDGLDLRRTFMPLHVVNVGFDIDMVLGDLSEALEIEAEAMGVRLRHNGLATIHDKDLELSKAVDGSRKDAERLRSICREECHSRAVLLGLDGLELDLVLVQMIFAILLEVGYIVSSLGLLLAEGSTDFLHLFISAVIGRICQVCLCSSEKIRSCIAILTASVECYLMSSFLVVTAQECCDFVNGLFHDRFLLVLVDVSDVVEVDCEFHDISPFFWSTFTYASSHGHRVHRCAASWRSAQISPVRIGGWCHMAL